MRRQRQPRPAVGGRPSVGGPHPRIWLVLLSVLSGAALIGAKVSNQPRVSTPTIVTHVVMADRTEHVELAQWALGRFDQADLTLPPVHISIHRAFAACGLRAGVCEPGVPTTIQVCGVGLTPSSADRMLVLHELAHAWAETELDSAAKAGFIDRQGLEVWMDGEYPPSEWGAEHAAEIVAWGLMTEPRPMPTGDGACASDADAFELLVGRQPLHTSD